MTYSDIADITESGSLRRRLSAAAAQEGKSKPVEVWVSTFIWEIASAPGWADAWASAVAGHIPDPGDDEGVITDGMILAVVQPLPADLPPEVL
jgi:hypothetical protein